MRLYIYADAGDAGLACQSGSWIVNAGDTALVDAVANHARGRQMTLGHTTVPVDGDEVGQIEPETHGRYRTVAPVFSTIHPDVRGENYPPESSSVSPLYHTA